MTYYSHVKTITISQFKAHISRELQNVRKGERIIIQDRKTPIAEVIPYEKENLLCVTTPRHKPSFKRPSFKVDSDPLDFLFEDREKR